MPLEGLVFVAIAGILIAAALTVAEARRRELDAIRRVVGADRSADLTRAVRDAVRAGEEADARRRRLEDDVALLLDLLGLGVVRLDDDLVVRTANKAARQMLDSGSRTLEGRSAIDAFGDHRVEAVVEQAARSGAGSAELALGSRGERIVQVRARRSIASGIWIVLRDVSELRRLQRIRTEFIDNLSHELRTPLSTVRLLTETVARDLERVDVPPRIRDRILKIDVETGHLVQMVNELLDLSRIEQGATQLHLDEVDIGDVIRGAVERLRPFAERQGVSIHPDLPRDGELPPIRGDEERLGQLLVNLLHNAVKFSEAGDTVMVTARPEGGELEFSVADEGVGIPRADLDRVFERFYKVDKARVRGKGGTGLGLAIARHIAEGHGGRIWVESEEGRGSTFRVRVPAESLPGEPAGYEAS